MDGPLVSIGLTTYNRPQALSNALKRLLSQTYTNIEVLIADDNPGSTENEKAVEPFLSDSRVKYLRKDLNEGMNINFGFALSHAKGKYFMWAADDDYWDVNFVKACVTELMNNQDVVMACCDTVFIDNEYREIGYAKECIDTRGLDAYGRFEKYFLNSQKCNFGFYGLYRIEMLRRLYFPNYISNDRLMMLELSLRGSFAQLPRKLFYYNKSGSSTSIVSYLNAIKRKLTLPRISPHLAFVLFHYKSVALHWKGLTTSERIRLIIKLHKLFKKVNMYSKIQLKWKRR